MKKSIFTSMALCVLLVFTTEAEVPQLINYQGVLSDSAGASLDGTFDITFKLYSQPVAGTEFWTETHSGAAVNDGLFAVILGSITPFFGAAKSVTSHEIWLGITVGTDPEMSPRTQFISVPFAFEADRAVQADTADYAYQSGSSVTADTADYAGRSLFSDTSDYASNSFRADTAEVANSVINNSIGSAQLIDNNVTSQDIADSTVIGVDIAKNTIRGTHLVLGAVNSEKIADGTILEADLSYDPATQSELNSHQSNASAHHTKTTNATELVSGTVDDSRLSSNVPLENTTNTFSNTNTFTGTLKIGDSTMIVNNIGISIGRNGSPASSILMIVRRNYNTTNVKYGYFSDLNNQSSGVLVGVYSDVTNNLSTGNDRFGLYGSAGSNANTSGSSFGVFGIARGGTGTSVYGVYGQAFGLSTNKYAGWFEGDAHVNGTLSKAAGSFKIDHPLDPANKYLVHSFVESPDMMNVYNGNVTTDGNGDAVVTLPDYFDALNKDFRYQLTVLGQFAQVIVSQKISGNQFSIRTDIPNVEVSWQVTGVRKDAYAEAHRIEVEPDKPTAEKGLYLHPVELGISETKQLHYEMHQAQLLERERAASETTQGQ